MANLTEKIEIESFERFQDEIIIETASGTQRIVSMPDYEKWLRRNGKLDWVIDGCECGEHTQVNGIMSMDEYWDLHQSYHLQELSEYLTYISNKNTHSLKQSA